MNAVSTIPGTSDFTNNKSGNIYLNSWEHIPRKPYYFFPTDNKKLFDCH